MTWHWYSNRRSCNYASNYYFCTQYFPVNKFDNSMIYFRTYLFTRKLFMRKSFPQVKGTSSLLIKLCSSGLPVAHRKARYRVSQKNATSYISLDFRENRKPVFIIYTLLERYISQLSTMKKSQWNDIPVGRYPPKHDTPSDVQSRATGTGLLIHKLALICLLSPV